MKNVLLFCVFIATFFFTSTAQNVGIGTSSPGNKLSVQTTTANDGIYATDGTRWMLN